MTDAINAYKAGYWHGATRLFFREYNPVRGAASYVYDAVGSGGIGATAGQFAVAKYARKELHYHPRVLASGSVAMSIEGRAAFMGTWSQIATVVLTTAQATKMSIFSVTEKVDLLRVGIRAASPTATDRFTCYGVFS